MKLFQVLIPLAINISCSCAYAQKDRQCTHWVTTIYDHYVDASAKLITNSPLIASLRQSVQAIDKMVKENSAYNSLKELRLRTHFWLNNGSIFGAHINVNGYSKKGWDENCGIIPQADRIAANDANLHFDINLPGPLSIPVESVYGYLQDINAFAEPEKTSTISTGIPVFHTYITRQEFALLTFNGKVPWIPLTLNEYFDAYANELRKKTAEFEAEKKRASYPENLAQKEKKTRETYEKIKARDPKQAEEYLAMKKKQEGEKIEHKKMETARLARRDSMLKKEWNDFEQFRNGFSAQELQQQAIVGNGGPYGLYKDGPNRKKYPMVKLAPGFVSNPANKNSIRMIMVRYTAENSYDRTTRNAFETLDYAMLQRLMK